MKAPDKVYIASYNGEAFSHSWTMEPLEDTTATEYIRKDALLEWAQEKLQEKHAPQFRDALGQLIDKLNLM